MVFSKGDLVISKNTLSFYLSDNVDRVIKGNIYKVSHYNEHSNICLDKFAGFGGSGDHGYFDIHFTKIIYLTKNRKFKLIKQKLGVQWNLKRVILLGV